MQAENALQLPDNTIEILAALLFAAILGGAVAMIAGGVVRRLVASLEGHTHLSDPLRQAPVRLVRLAMFVVSTIAFAFPALAFIGVTLPAEPEAELDEEEVPADPAQPTEADAEEASLASEAVVTEPGPQ